MGRMVMSSSFDGLLLLTLGLLASFLLRQTHAANSRRETKICYGRSSPCFMKKQICPPQCPSFSPEDPKAKVCYVDCSSPVCLAQCRNRKPNCNGKGSACLDPRFIGGDGIVFYFHGRRDEHFSLVSDLNLQINARFIGLRPEGRTRDFTWIQALGVLSGANSLALEAKKASKWDDEEDHLRFSYNREEITIPEEDLSSWESREGDVRVERTSSKNSVLVTLPEIVEISVNVVPITKEDDRIHNYRIPADDCFAHLEVQFRFLGALSSKVEGVLGRTYRLDFENPAKPGVAMPVVGGEDRYKTSSLVAANCAACVFSPGAVSGEEQVDSLLVEQATIDCTGRAGNGSGIVCRK